MRQTRRNIPLSLIFIGSLTLLGFVFLIPQSQRVFSSTSGSTSVGGGIYEDTIWKKSGSPYLVTDTVVLFQGYKLIIEPGVEVRSYTHGLEVRGTLIAEGTLSEPIVFTSARTDPFKGSWSGIRVRSSLGGSASIKYAKFSYAYKAISIEADYLSSTPPLGGPVNVYDSVFTDNEVGLMGNSPVLTTIERSIFEDNSIGAWGDGRRVFCNSVFLNNGSGLAHGEGTRVYTSLFRENTFGILGSNAEIQYSEFTGNRFAIEGGGKISYSVIINNQTGIAGALLGEKNVIYNNYSPARPVVSWNYKVWGPADIYIPNNWWGTTDRKAIDAGIYDGYDDLSLGRAFYEPTLDEPPVLTPPAFCLGSIPTPTPTPGPEARQNVIPRLYWEVLCRGIDPPGYQYWLNSPLTTEQIRQELINSPEGQRVAAVRSLYTSILARDPMPTDCGGLRSWVDSSLSLDAIRASLEASGEGQRVATVRQLYIELLGRDPLGSDNAGLRYWVQLPLPVSDIRRLIMESEEYRRTRGG